MNSPQRLTISGLLADGCASRPAIHGVDGVSLTYGQLRDQVNGTHEILFRSGVGGGDTVVTSLRNGPESAALFLALASYCRVAPLNPALKSDEIAFALRELGAKAIVTTANGADANHAADQCGVGRIQITGSGGAYQLQPEMARSDSSPKPSAPRPDDVALLLYTSGTTARPKLVPLTHRNLCLSACGVAEMLDLSPADRCLSVMPLFHIHGLVAGLLASIAAGGSVYCAPGFNALSFFSWLDSSQATWYTAVPTMHQMILARARLRAGDPRGNLRLIRSSSSPLYPVVWREIERVFGVPVVNAYGMTEAAHQITSVRIPGGCPSRTTVGLPSGPEVAIMDPAGSQLPCGQTGEVVLRGEQIMSGYLHPPGANETAFSNGWFRTGDEGFLDSGGALTLTGRLKEIINSGGEKISPYEVEEALLLHPDVAQAVAFAAPHALLGEEVAAAVVMREGSKLSARELLQALGKRLARHKLPNRLLFLDEIPRGATGKLQRIGLAARLGLSAAKPSENPA